jgi:hypothetical protein
MTVLGLYSQTPFELQVWAPQSTQAPPPLPQAAVALPGAQAPACTQPVQQTPLRQVPLAVATMQALPLLFGCFSQVSAVSLQEALLQASARALQSRAGPAQLPAVQVSFTVQ